MRWRRGVVWVLLCVVGAGAVAGEAAAKRLRSPTISPRGGHYDLNEVIRIDIRCEANACIVYTLDGTLPSEAHGERTGLSRVSFILPPGDVVVRAVAVRAGFERSPIRTATFTRSDLSAKP